MIGGDHPAELRTGVGIDRVTGAAADRIRFEREVLPPGTAIGLRLRYDGDTGAGLDALRELLSAVRADGLRVGGATRRGLGRLTCDDVTEQVVDLRSRAGVLDWFRGKTATAALRPRPGGADGRLSIAVSWRPWRPVVVGAGGPAEDAQLVPVMTRSATGDGLVPVLPGASVKGVLRSAAERVVRTVLTPGLGIEGAVGLEPSALEPAPDFVRAMDELCARVAVLEALFGSRRRAGALSVPDTAADAPLINAKVWADYLAGAGTPNAAEGGAGRAAGWDRPRSHVAIDRWTGGGAGQLLFTVQELAGVHWPPIVLEVDTRALHRALADDDRQVRAALVLLGCVIGMLLDGDVGFGHGTRRGLGEVEVTGLQVLLPSGLGLPEFPETAADVDLDDLRELWWMWLADLAPEGGWVHALRPVADATGGAGR